jgi:hypothetical protein
MIFLHAVPQRETERRFDVAVIKKSAGIGFKE